MFNKINLRTLEIHVANSCNLECDGCQHWTNHKLAGVLKYQIGSEWLKAWAKRLNPSRFKLMGGEPFLNKELYLYVILAYELFPNAQRFITTNALLANYASDDLKFAIKHSGTTLIVSRHSKDQKYLAQFEEAIREIKKWGINFFVDDVNSQWYRGYSGHGNDIKPYNDQNPRASWEQCACNTCIQLHENKLWKCPPVAYWHLLNKKFPKISKEAWAPFFEYRPLLLNATDEELEEFVNREEEDSVCSLCPSNPVFYEKNIWPKS